MVIATLFRFRGFVRVLGTVFICIVLLMQNAVVHADEWIYSIQAGENLWDFADRYLVNASYAYRVQALNRISDPYHIPPGTAIRVPVRWLKAVPFVARVQELHGECTVTEEDTGKTEALSPGSLLIEGDSLTTGADGSLTLEFIDGSRLFLRANSHLQVHRLGVYGDTGMADTRLRLDKGRVETQVTPRRGPATRFEISTPSAITSVRGTDYRVSQEENAEKTRAEVVGGKVGVQGAGVTRVVALGQGTVVEADRAPLPPVPLLPAPDRAKLPATLDRVPIQFSFPGVEGSKGHRVQISTQADFTRLLVDQAVTGDVFKGPDLPDGQYYLRVRAIDRLGLEGLNADRKVELNARPEPPFLLEPKPGLGVAEEQPAFVWSRPVGIRTFRIQVARDASFAEPVLEVAEHPESQWVASEKLPLGRFFWRVAAIDEREGAGPFSDPQELRRVVPAPAMEEPDMSGERLLIRCRNGLPGQRYQFQLAEDQSFDQVLFDRTVDVPTLELDKPGAGTYYVRVRTIDPDGFQNPYGPPQMLEIPRSWYWWLALLPLFALFAL